MPHLLPTRRIVLVAVPPLEEVDLFGPVSCFLAANRESQAMTPPYQLDIVAGTEGNNIAGHSGIALLSTQCFTEVSGHIDTLIIASGREAHLSHSKKLLNWIRQTAARSRRVVSICTGAFLLAEAGLLQQRRATTHWQWTQQLARSYPAIQVQADAIWTQDGKFYTSAGVTTGIDLALALIEEDLGSASSLQVARDMVVFLRRPGGQTQFSVALTKRQPESPSLHQLQLWIADHLDSDLSVERLAEHMAMSPRNFSRIFKQEIGETPARYVQQVRVEQARRMLEQDVSSLERIAATCGYRDVQLLRRALQRELGVSPGAYRARFRARAM